MPNAGLLDEPFVEIFSIESLQKKIVPLDEISGNCRNTLEYIRRDLVVEGLFGPVYSAKEIANGRLVSMKFLPDLQDPAKAQNFHSLREISVLTGLNHSNILNLVDVAREKSGRFCLILEPFMAFDSLKMGQWPYPLPVTKCVLRSVLKALDYLHSKCIVHRGVELGNLAIGGPSTKEMRVKLGGFRFARKFTIPSSEEKLTPKETDETRICCRPPDQLLGSKSLKPTTDIWAVGCMFVDLVSEHSMLKGGSGKEQLEEIVGLLGTPTEAIWPEMSELPLYGKFDLKSEPFNNVGTAVRGLSDAGVVLLKALLSYDPKKRPTAALALDSQFFVESPKAYSCKELLDVGRGIH